MSVPTGCARCATSQQREQSLPPELRTQVPRRAQRLGGDRPRDRRDPPLPRRLHPLLRGATRDRRRPRARAHEGRGAAAARQERARWPLLQDPQAGRDAGRPDHRQQHRGADHAPRTATRNGKPTLTWTRDHDAIAAAAQTDGIYALATNLPGTRLTAGQTPARLQRPADRRAPPPRLQTDPQSPADLPAQRRPHLRADQHHRDRAADLRTDRNRDSAKRSATTSSSPACCPRTAPPNPPDATCSASSKDSASPTPAPASNSTASPTPNAASSNSSRSHHPGPNNSRQHLTLSSRGKWG